MAFHSFTPNVLGFVLTLNQQSHKVNKTCLQSYLPVFPANGFPIIQFEVLSSEASSYTFELFDLENNLITSQTINPITFTILENIPNTANENDPYNILITNNTDWGVGAGCYYLCISFVRNNEVCRYYTNAFQLTTQCLHYVEFTNNCNTGSIFYQNSIYRPRIYFKGDIDLIQKPRTNIEREQLLNGCYRIETAETFIEYHWNNHFALNNFHTALSWAFGHDNVKFVCGNGVQLQMNNAQIGTVTDHTRKQQLYKLSFSFEGQYLNPQGCCEDYTDGISFDPMPKPNTDCQPCIIEAGQISATCDTITISINSDYPVSLTIDNNLIESNFTGTTYTFAGLTPDNTGTIEVQSQCGLTTISYQTTPNTLAITATPIDIECGETTGNVNINLTGVTGLYTVTVCDNLNNPLFSTNNIQDKGWVDASQLVAGTYIVKVEDENCSQTTTFEILEACVCNYSYQYVVTNCSCDNLGSIFIDTVQWTVGDGNWQIDLCDSSNNVIASTQVDNFTFTGLFADTYTLKLTETNPNCLITNIAVVADTCECIAPNENSIIYSNGNVIFANTGADQYTLTITPIAGNGGITIVDTINNPSPNNGGFLGYGNKDIVCGTTYEVKITAKCSVGQKNKEAKSDWVLFVTEDCPPCGEQELDIVVNIGISGQFQVQGVPVNAPGALVEYSSNGSAWSTVSPLLSQTNCFSINAFSAANSNFYVFDDPTNTNNHCIAFELGSGLIDPVALADLQNCNEILRLQLIGTPYIFVLDPALAIVTQPTSNVVHISYPKNPQTKYRSTTTVDLLNSLSTGATPAIVQTVTTLQFRCCYITSYGVFVRMTYLDCPLIGKCVFVYSNTDYNVEDVELDPNGNVV